MDVSDRASSASGAIRKYAYLRYQRNIIALRSRRLIYYSGYGTVVRREAAVFQFLLAFFQRPPPGEIRRDRETFGRSEILICPRCGLLAVALSAFLSRDQYKCPNVDLVRSSAQYGSHGNIRPSCTRSLHPSCAPLRPLNPTPPPPPHHPRSVTDVSISSRRGRRETR